MSQTHPTGTNSLISQLNRNGGKAFGAEGSQGEVPGRVGQAVGK